MQQEATSSDISPLSVFLILCELYTLGQVVLTPRLGVPINHIQVYATAIGGPIQQAHILDPSTTHSSWRNLGNALLCLKKSPKLVSSTHSTSCTITHFWV